MLGELSALATAFCWTGSSLAFSSAVQRVGSIYVNVTRLIFALVYLLLTIIVMGLNVQLTGAQILYLGISGFWGLVFGDSFLFKSYQENGARISMLIMSSSPAIAALLAFFFIGEILTFTGILGMAVTIIGISIVILERTNTSSPRLTISRAGFIYGLLGSLGQAAGLIFARMAFDLGPINGFVATFFRIATSTIILLPILVMMRRYRNPVTVFRNDKKALQGTITGSILGPFFGITFSLIAVSHTEVGIAATIMATPPILMLPLLRYVYKESLSWKAIGGAIVAVAGVAMLFIQ
jgi:drug/metabolite transporter (DMT)-like permease